jgi:hypothetical protein
VVTIIRSLGGFLLCMQLEVLDIATGMVSEVIVYARIGGGGRREAILDI